MNNGIISKIIYEENKILIEVSLDLTVEIAGITKNIAIIKNKPELLDKNKQFDVSNFGLIDFNKKYSFEFDKIGDNIKIKSIIIGN